MAAADALHPAAGLGGGASAVRGGPEGNAAGGLGKIWNGDGGSRAPAGRAGGAVTDTTLCRLAERLSAMERATLQGGRRIANRLLGSPLRGPRVRIPSLPSAVNRGALGETSRLYPGRGARERRFSGELIHINSARRKPYHTAAERGSLLTKLVLGRTWSCPFFARILSQSLLSRPNCETAISIGAIMGSTRW